MRSTYSYDTYIIIEIFPVYTVLFFTKLAAYVVKLLVCMFASSTSE